MKTNTTHTKSATLTMGLPAAGKSTVVKRLFNLKNYTIIDPDMEKESHKDYDPKNPAALHAWSLTAAQKKLDQALVEGRNVIIDGTGTNADKMHSHIRKLRANGYSVQLLYVKVSLETSLERNAKRERNVPEDVVKEKAELIESSYELIKPYVDSIFEVINE